MSFHIINIDDEQLAPTSDLPEAAARLADMIHAAVDGLSELPADANPDEVLAAFTAWTHARIGLAEGRILLLLNDRGVPITSLVKVTGISDYGVRDRMTWARIERQRATDTRTAAAVTVSPPRRAE